MASAGFELRYGQISLASDVVPSQVGPTVAFVGAEHPVPVGTQVELVGESLTLLATVIRVVEALKGRDSFPGMWIRLKDLESAAAVWQPLVSGPDPDIPEPPGQAAVADPAMEKSAQSEPEAKVEPEPEPEPEPESESQPAAEDDGTPGARAPKSTMVMSAVDIREALGQEPVVEAGAPRADADPGNTQPIGSGMLDGGEPAGKKKRRKRKRKKN